jgi:bifunctional non-homologous end joining protein LigD
MAKMPIWMEPMAATLTEERFAGPDWIFERKYDGIRGLAFKDGKRVRLLSRNQLPQHNPEVIEAIAALEAKDAILDGELSWREQKNAFDVFDILWLNGNDLTQLPLMERRALLRTLLRTLPRNSVIRTVPEVKGEKPWEQACADGWEGVIAKRRDSRYEHRRSPYWLKMKCEASQELVVGGFTDPQGSRAGYGALLVGYYDGDDFVYAGRVGTSQETKELVAMRERLDPIEIAKSPFTRAIGLPKKGAHWVKPKIVVQVQFLEWTGDGKMRHSRLIAVRHDKRARDVVREMK